VSGEPVNTVMWSPSLNGSQRSDALAAARMIADRVTDAERVAESLALASMQTQYPRSMWWEPATIAQGDTGIALLCSQLHAVYPGEGWDALARQHLARAARAVYATHHGAGAFTGYSGILFTSRLAGHSENSVPISELSAQVAHQALTTAAAIRGVSGLSVSSFDIISGLSGIMLCLLPSAGRDSMGAAVPFLEGALAAMALHGQDLPAWYTPTDRLYDDEQRALYPCGNLNVGLAHGMPGPLAALSLAVASRPHADPHTAIAGDTGDVRVAAVARLASWLSETAVIADGYPGWPSVVPLAETDGRLHATDPGRIGRDAWCYGTPGAARALYLAGRTLDRSDWRELAVAAMAGVYARPVPMRAIDSPTFCHGVAGLLQITLRFLHDTGLPIFADAARELTTQILDSVDADRPMAIANVEPGGNLVDQPGLLDGAAGVSLVLLSAGSDVEPAWDRVFGLS
jgi:hypothetical protein